MALRSVSTHLAPLSASRLPPWPDPLFSSPVVMCFVRWVRTVSVLMGTLAVQIRVGNTQYSMTPGDQYFGLVTPLTVTGTQLLIPNGMVGIDCS